MPAINRDHWRERLVAALYIVQRTDKGREKEDTYEIHVDHSMICRSGPILYSELLEENGYPRRRMVPWRRWPGTRSSYRTGASDKVSEPQIPMCSCYRGGFLTTRQSPGVVKSTPRAGRPIILFFTFISGEGNTRKVS